MKNLKMKLTKRIMALLMAVMMVVTMSVPALAAESFTLPVSIQKICYFENDLSS